MARCKGGLDGYYNQMRGLTHGILRRLWIAEGKRRGFELVDA